MSGDDPRKRRSRELAERLAMPEGLRAARLSPHPLAPSPIPSPQPGEGEGPKGRRAPEPISIWQPQMLEDSLAFVRPEPSPLGDHHAATRVLRPKRAELPLRVCFFGESVAAGYLYAPHLTPAGVLERQLRAVGGADNFEVIDLARTNETLPSLAATVRSALQIQPDMLVLFVGNNWNLLETPEVSPYAPSVRARQRYAEALRKSGLLGPVWLAADELRRSAEATLGFIADIARTIGIPVIVVIPEVNLVDWETRQPLTWFPGDAAARWYALYDRTQALLDGGAFAEAASVAREMLDLDGGTCSTSWRLLARARLGEGDLDEARRACLAEIDASAYATLGFLSAPQATTAARDLLKEAARRPGVFSVDLRQVFAEHTGSALPDRRLFLDYCHLTAEGIHVAMAAVAAEVLNLSGMREQDVAWPELLPRLPAPDLAPEVEATARLGAAIHTAHRMLPVGPKRPILEYWLEAALDASPGIEATMLDLLAVRAAPCPAVLTAEQQRNLDSPYRLTLQHGWRWDHLDADLLQAIVEVLERRGRPAREELTRHLLAHHALREDGTELAHPAFYHWEPLERFYPEVMSFEDLAQRATYRSPWPVSSFCLICDGERDLELDLTARLSRTGPVHLSIDGEDVGTAEVGERWTRAVLRVDRRLLRPGLNRLALRWPEPPPRGEEALQQAIERLELGIAADLHPVFGEVFSLIARPC
ncbi:MAG TPA: hypothetical protein VEL74_09120 [Thermoanaerobaculia bacterium]|nr:hypothetical protein [Thermoanaerobaculia bacterium]